MASINDKQNSSYSATSDFRPNLVHAFDIDDRRTLRLSDWPTKFERRYICSDNLLVSAI